jgi:hypothetical protein
MLRCVVVRSDGADARASARLILGGLDKMTFVFRSMVSEGSAVLPRFALIAAFLG